MVSPCCQTHASESGRYTHDNSRDISSPEYSGAERDLTSEELREFTRWINQGSNCGNYGFLLSEYTRPEDVDLSQVFYAGAGIENMPLSEAERAEYLKITGDEEIHPVRSSRTQTVRIHILFNPFIR